MSALVASREPEEPAHQERNGIVAPLRDNGDMPTGPPSATGCCPTTDKEHSTTTTLMPMRAEDREWIISMALAGHTHLASQQQALCSCWHCQAEGGDDDRRTESLAAAVAAFRDSGVESAIERRASEAMPAALFTDEERRVAVLAAKTYLVNTGELVPN